MSKNIDSMKNVKTIRDVDIKNKRVLIRVDFNVPMDNNLNISDDKRIKETIPTINYCIDNKAKYIVLVSHLGRPKEREEKYSLKNLLQRLERLLDRPVTFVDRIEKMDSILKTMDNQSVILLENIRFYKEEEKNGEELSQKLANLCDVFVNDAFGTSHRKHSSIYGIANFVNERVAGLLLKKEIDSFARVLANPTRPVLLIVGGSKISSKLTLLENILCIVDRIIIGGAMSHTFLKAIGYNMQNSMIEEELVNEAKQILLHARDKNVKIYLPVDFVSTDNIDERNNIKITPAQDIPENYIAVDIGPASIKLFNEVIADSPTIMWNGPLGIYEIDRFNRGTFSIARSIADSYSFSLIGGGDTADAATKAGEIENMSFVSTGGGASLELLEDKILPAFEILNKKN